MFLPYPSTHACLQAMGENALFTECGGISPSHTSEHGSGVMVEALSRMTTHIPIQVQLFSMLVRGGMSRPSLEVEACRSASRGFLA